MIAMPVSATAAPMRSHLFGETPSTNQSHSKATAT